MYETSWHVRETGLDYPCVHPDTKCIHLFNLFCLVLSCWLSYRNSLNLGKYYYFLAFNDTTVMSVHPDHPAPLKLTIYHVITSVLSQVKASQTHMWKQEVVLCMVIGHITYWCRAVTSQKQTGNTPAGWFHLFVVFELNKNKLIVRSLSKERLENKKHSKEQIL